jgi:hypothetical protein
MGNIEKLKTKFNLNTQILNVLDKEAEILKTASMFQNAVDQLSSNQKILKDLNVLIVKDISNIEKNKNDIRKELLKSTIMVTLILQVFAFDTGKKKLKERLEYLTSDYIRQSSDTELVKIAKKILLLANKYSGISVKSTGKSKLESKVEPVTTIVKFEKEYGLYPEMVKNIEESRIRFIESMNLYLDEMKEKRKMAINVKVLTKQNEKLLKEKIDRFVLLFEMEKPDFFNEYQQLRGIRAPEKTAKKQTQKSKAQIELVAGDKKNPSEDSVKAKSIQSSKAEIP